VLTALLLLPALVVANCASSAQTDPNAVAVTVLVDGSVDYLEQEAQTLSAGRLTLDSGRSSLLVTSEGTTFVLVETGTVRLETDQRIPGAPRLPDRLTGLPRSYGLGPGVRVELQPGTRLRLHNDGPDPVTLFLLSLVPAEL